MPPTWKFYLAQSEPLEYIADISRFAKNKSLSVALNKPGTLSFDVKLDSLWASTFRPVNTCVIVHKNNTPVWGGPIWTRTPDFNANNLGINAVGWFELLNKRLLVDDETYTGQKDGDIAHDLLNILNSYYDTGISAGTQDSNSYRDIEYEQFQNVGEAITNLTEIEAGFDFSIHPTEKTLDIIAWDGHEETDIIYAYNWGPNNLSSFSYEESAESMANEIFVSGEVGTAEADDTDSVEEYQLFQEQISISDPANINLLGAIANAELVVNSNPGIVYSMEPKVNNDISIFEDYQIGDHVNIVAHSLNGGEHIDEGVRVFAATINIDEEGNEKVSSLQTTYQGQ